MWSPRSRGRVRDPGPVVGDVVVGGGAGGRAACGQVGIGAVLVPADGFLPGQGDVLGPGTQVGRVTGLRTGRDVLLQPVAAGRVGHRRPPVVPCRVDHARRRPGETVRERTRPPPRAGRRPCAWGREVRNARSETRGQKTASSTSISELSVFSTIARSEDSRGSTWVVKNRVAASLPS